MKVQGAINLDTESDKVLKISLEINMILFQFLNLNTYYMFISQKYVNTTNKYS